MERCRKKGSSLVGENFLHEHSLVAQRIICDHLRAVGGVLNVPITKKLLAAAASSRQKYEKHLQNQRDKKKTASKPRQLGSWLLSLSPMLLERQPKRNSSITRSWRQIKWKVRNSKGLLKRYAKIFLRTFSTAGSVLICTVRIYYFAYVI